MRVRFYPRDDGTIKPVAEIQVGKGKKAFTGRRVALEDFRKEVRRLIKEARGEPAEPE